MAQEFDARQMFALSWPEFSRALAGVASPGDESPVKQEARENFPDPLTRHQALFQQAQRALQIVAISEGWAEEKDIPAFSIADDAPLALVQVNQVYEDQNKALNEIARGYSLAPAGRVVGSEGFLDACEKLYDAGFVNARKSAVKFMRENEGIETQYGFQESVDRFYAAAKQIGFDAKPPGRLPKPGK